MTLSSTLAWLFAKRSRPPGNLRVQRPSWRGHLLAVLRAAVVAHLRVHEAEQLWIGLPVRELSAQEGCGSAGVHVSGTRSRRSSSRRPEDPRSPGFVRGAPAGDGGRREPWCPVECTPFPMAGGSLMIAGCSGLHVTVMKNVGGPNRLTRAIASSMFFCLHRGPPVKPDERYTRRPICCRGTPLLFGMHELVSHRPPLLLLLCPEQEPIILDSEPHVQAPFPSSLS